MLFNISFIPQGYALTSIFINQVPLTKVFKLNFKVQRLLRLSYSAYFQL